MNDFIPEYDAAGNQTLVKTATGIWSVSYNAQNRAVKFENITNGTIITCAYDYMGRRFEKKVSVNGATTLHERYIYRKTPDGCKGGWTCAKHAPRRGDWCVTCESNQLATCPVTL